MKFIYIALALALVGCSDRHYRTADERVVCSLQGEAFYVRRHIGDTSFVMRMPDSDPLCLRMKQ